MFFEFGIKDFIDILLVAFVLYYTYKLMKASGSIKVFTGILVFILIELINQLRSSDGYLADTIN